MCPKSRTRYRTRDRAANDLAVATGYSPSHVSRWLRDERPARPLEEAIERVTGRPASEVRASLRRRQRRSAA